MTRLPRTYRLASALLVFVLTMASVGPVVEHLCMSTGEAVAGHVTDRAAHHACCADGCTVHSSTLDGGEAPVGVDAVCCMLTASAPVEAAAVTAPEAPRAEVVLVTALLPTWSERVPVPPLRPAPSDAEPPPPPVRFHLAVSVLLI